MEAVPERVEAQQGHVNLLFRSGKGRKTLDS